MNIIEQPRILLKSDQDVECKMRKMNLRGMLLDWKNRKGL